jgi:uncharacterized membrane protein HdeD (DUF308 family)
MRTLFARRVLRDIGEIADLLRERAGRTAGFPHPVSRIPDYHGPRHEQQSDSQPHYREVHEMESTFDRATKTAQTQLTKMRWALGLNGLLLIAVGVVVLVWPGISLFALTILVGAYALATGVIGLAAALSGAGSGERGWLVVSSLLGIAIGVIVLVWPDISELALLYVIGAYAVALGVLAIGAAFYLPLDGGDTALMVLGGIISILFGIVIFAKPGDGALAVLALIAAFALVTGITELVVAISAKRVVSNGLKRALEPEPHPST